MEDMTAKTAVLCAALARLEWSDSAITAFRNEGFKSMDDVGIVADAVLKETCKKIRAGRPGVAGARGQEEIPSVQPVDIPMLQEVKLIGMHLWIAEKNRLGRTIDANEFDVATSMAYAHRVREAYETVGKGPDEGTTKLPDAFSGKAGEWPTFYRLVINHLSMKKNRNRTPLSYVLLPEDAAI